MESVPFPRMPLPESPGLHEKEGNGDGLEASTLSRAERAAAAGTESTGASGMEAVNGAEAEDFDLDFLCVAPSPPHGTID